MMGIKRSAHQQRIDTMMGLMGQDVPKMPTEPDEETRILRARLIMEEAFETIEKGLGLSVAVYADAGETIDMDDLEFYVTDHFDMIELADGCADLSVVTIGTLSACGIDDSPLLKAVDQNNLEKFSGDGHRDEHGKWIKPTDHQPPNIEAILELQKAQR